MLLCKRQVLEKFFLIGTSTAQLTYLHLPSFGPGFKSQAQIMAFPLSDSQILYYICIVKVHQGGRRQRHKQILE